MSMSPHDMVPYRENFDAACKRLGWKVVTSEVQHERDESCSWTEQVWVNRDGNRLFAEGDLTRAMVEEIIYIACVIRELKL